MAYPRSGSEDNSGDGHVHILSYNRIFSEISTLYRLQRT